MVLTAAQRLRRRDEFVATIRRGRRAGRSSLVVYQLSTDADGSRAGFVVGKAVGNAVTRNKVRRRLRHLMRERMTRLPPGTDLVVRALPASADHEYHQLASDLDDAITAALRARRAPGTMAEPR